MNRIGRDGEASGQKTTHDFDQGENEIREKRDGEGSIGTVDRPVVMVKAGPMRMSVRMSVRMGARDAGNVVMRRRV